MKNKFAAILLLLVVLLFPAYSQSAGSWVSNSDSYQSSLFKFSKTFTADAADASIPTWPLTKDKFTTSFYGCITGIEAVFDGTTPPSNTLTVDLKTPSGQSLFGPITVASTGWIRAMDETPVCIVGGIAGTFTGNTTNSAIAEIIVHGFQR